MKKTLIKRLVTLCVIATLVFGTFSVTTGCGGSRVLCNINTPFVRSIQQPEGVFSPFFSGTAMDGDITSMTQIGMFTADIQGNLAFGSEFPVVTQDLSMRIIENATTPTTLNPLGRRTVYQFVIKDDIKFSDGTPLTIHDVLFNYYMLLDPAYTGLSTMNSVNIVGLRAYRTQNPTATEATEQAQRLVFRNEASARIREVNRWLSNSANVIPTAQVLADTNRAIALFRSDLEGLWDSSVGGVQALRDQYYPVNYDWEVFMFNAGLLDVQRDAHGHPLKVPDANQKEWYVLNQVMRNGLLVAYSQDHGNVFNKESSVAIAFQDFAPDANIVAFPPTRMREVLQFWRTGGELTTEFVNEAMTAHAATQDRRVFNIEGIRVVRGDEFEPCDRSHSETAYTENEYVLQITIDGVDPRAIWSFGTTVAPMHWYTRTSSNPAQCLDALARADNVFCTQPAISPTAKSNFGVVRANLPFMQHVQGMNGTPMGAGPYRMGLAPGASAGSYADNFFVNNVVYMVRNEHFYTVSGSNAIIRQLRFQVTNQANIMSTLANESVHFADPSATPANIAIVTANRSLRQEMVWTNGYGYIGISARHIPNLHVRRAIMTAIDVRYVRDYFPGDLSRQLHRGMSFQSWVHRNYDDEGQFVDEWENGHRSHYVTFDPDDEDARLREIRRHLTNAGAQENEDGNWQLNEQPLRYTFHVAGNSTEHPAWMMFEMAARLLNAHGWNITVRPNNRVLTELTAGRGLSVWAAAWSSGLDPCMFQLWHRNSTAASVRNWGYDFILDEGGGVTAGIETGIINRLRESINASRATLDQRERTTHIRQALDTAMELAVELPTYQRRDMFVFNNDIIDSSSLEQVITSNWSPLQRIWNVRLRTNCACC